jgi:hypothetical protein
MTEPTPVTEDGEVIGLPPATPPQQDEDITPKEPPPPIEPPAGLMASGADDPMDL